MNEPRGRRPTASTAGPQIHGDGGFQRLLIVTAQEQRLALEKERRQRYWSIYAAIAGMVLAILGGVLSFGVDYYSRSHDTLTERIASLTKSLNDSAQIISDIEQEVNRRQALLGKLQHDAEEAQNLAALNSAQANAVVQALRGELDREGNKSWWSSIIQGLVFAVLGAVFGVAASELWRRLRSRTAPTAPVINSPEGDVGTDESRIV